MKWNRVSMLMLAGLLAPALVGAAVITNGTDAWVTSPTGSSFADFANDPIPAGFFCSNSESFTGRIHWRGIPLAANPPEALANADTIVQRLDNVVFDSSSRGTTRLQVRALSMASLEPVRTHCGEFDATVSLAPGPQPVTLMELVEEQPGGGSWSARLRMNARLTFTPVRRTAATRPLLLEQSIELRVDKALWSDQSAVGEGGQTGGFVLVDTDGDLIPDTFLPGQSAFHLRGDDAISQRPEGPHCLEPGAYVCHWDEDAEYCHCVYEPGDYEFPLTD